MNRFVEFKTILVFLLTNLLEWRENCKTSKMLETPHWFVDSAEPYLACF